MLWFIPLLLHAPDAQAWGLYTHTFFAQALLWSVPLADPRFRRALTHHASLFLAATCLPDVSLLSGVLRNRTLGATHQWRAALRMLRSASDDRERAMGLGYATHLLTDIVAHQFFVPAHEAMWMRAPVITHATAEWAMDAHIAPHVVTPPARSVLGHSDELVAYAHAQLGIPKPMARRALTWLMRGEISLRRSRAPQMLYSAARRMDRGLIARFDEYLGETAQRLQQINRIIDGETPAWKPELGDATHAPPPAYLSHHPYLVLLPSDFFRDPKTV